MHTNIVVDMVVEWNEFMVGMGAEAIVVADA